MATKSTADLKAALLAKSPKRRDPIPDAALLKTGATLLDLAITGRRAGGFMKGAYYWVVGDSSSGKTFLTLTCLAEAAINPEFGQYRFIHDNNENGALMDFTRYFGPAMAKRVEAPGVVDGAPSCSRTIEEFYFNLDDAHKKAVAKGGKPFIYVLDSMDGLDTKYAEKKFQEAKTAARRGNKAKGDYGDGKAKINSQRIRTVVKQLQETGSILIVISQTRDNIDAGFYDDSQVAAGGHSLQFYATVQLWSSVGARLTKSVNGHDVRVGLICRVQVKKNRITGKDRTVEFPIYYDVGIDDLGGMVDFMVYWKFWPKSDQGFINAGEDFDGVNKRRDDLVNWLEDNNLRADMEDVVEDAWQQVEARISIKRKNKYHE